MRGDVLLNARQGWPDGDVSRHTGGVRPEKLLDAEKDTLVDASVIVEVVSHQPDDSTRVRSSNIIVSCRRSKSIFSSGKNPSALNAASRPDGSWTLGELAGADAVIELKSIGCQLKLGSLYARVQFETAE